MSTGPWQQTTCVLLQVQLRNRGPARGAQPRAHPRRQGAPRLAGLHLQQGDAARPLPERPPPADLADAPPCRRRASRRSAGRRAISEVAARFAAVRDEHGGESIFYYGGGGQGNHLGGAYSGAFLRALGSRYKSGAPAQEKPASTSSMASCTAVTRAATSSTRRSASSLRENPWQSQSFPRARVTLEEEIARPPARSMIVLNRVPHRDRRDGRLPPARATRRARGAWPRSARRSCRRDSPTNLPRRAHDGCGARPCRAGARADR